MKDKLFVLILVASVAFTSYFAGTSSGFNLGYNTAIADVVLGVVNPNSFIETIK